MHFVTPRDILRLAIESGRDPKTIRRFLRGGSVRPSAEFQIRAAFKNLSIELPEPRLCGSTSRETLGATDLSQNGGNQ